MRSRTKPEKLKSSPQGSQTRATGLTILTNILALADKHKVPQQSKLLFNHFFV